MVKPKAEIKQKEYQKQIRRFYQVLSKLEGEKQVRSFLNGILTPSESRMLHRRWHIASLLALGSNVRQVAKKAKVSTLTVMRIKKLLENPSHRHLGKLLKKAHKKKPRKTIRREKERVAPRLTYGLGKESGKEA